MSIRDEVVNFAFVLGKQGVDVGLVEIACALCLGQNEIGKEEEAEVGVKWEPDKVIQSDTALGAWIARNLPGDNEPGPGFNKGETR